MVKQQIKKIMNVSDLLPVINLPWEGTEQVEVNILLLQKDRKYTDPDELMGVLNEYANPELIPLEKDAWAIAVEEKYGNVRF